MIEEGIRRFTITSQQWGDILILRPLPDDEGDWGVLAPLKGTAWGDLIPVVRGESLSHALYGHATPLMQEIGRSPGAQAVKVPEPYRVCAYSKSCQLYNPKACHPSPKLPECYVPPHLETPEQRRAASLVALAWKDGRHVIVVTGDDEFSLRSG